MIFVTVGTLLAFGSLNGSHTVPDRPEWIAGRLAWPVASGGALAAAGHSPPSRHGDGTGGAAAPGTNPVPGPYISRGVS
ncbi:hypothetical protein ACFQY7_24655 [Actinomadura luteofluorescens]|uniref:hypothetical protein n=1 Tax=Actinomadura luteofluorescens TaxID=46163 RepID=UPI00362524D7